MRRNVILAFMLSLTFVMAGAAKNSQTVVLNTSVQVNSVTLPAGDYKVTWIGTGSDVKVTLSHRGIAPVTVQAKLVEEKNSHVSVTITSAPGGVGTLQSIKLHDVSLILNSGNASGN